MNNKSIYASLANTYNILLLIENLIKRIHYKKIFEISNPIKLIIDVIWENLCQL